MTALCCKTRRTIPPCQSSSTPELNEFHIVHSNGGGHMMIRHCFFCGGKAPESRRGTLFARVPSEEARRLAGLTQPLETVGAVLSALGKPDRDSEAGAMITTPEKDGQAEETRAYRTLVYGGLSEIADVHVTVYPLDRVAFSFRGKYLGKTPDQAAV